MMPSSSSRRTRSAVAVGPSRTWAARSRNVVRPARSSEARISRSISSMTVVSPVGHRIEAARARIARLLPPYAARMPTTPLADAVAAYLRDVPLPFSTPGHKRNPTLVGDGALHLLDVPHYA